MKPSEDPSLLAVVKATGEIYGKQVSQAAALMFLADLENYSSAQIMIALSKCRKELKFFPSVAEVVSRIDDGRPGIEEAWAMLPKSEQDSIVWTDEMAEANALCRDLMISDPIAARMAFKETYARLVSVSRDKGTSVNWTPSLGLDPRGRESVLLHAISKNRLTQAQVEKLLPNYTGDKKSGELKSIAATAQKLLGGK